jgi:MoaA/NifB/PqqE/SkfB family radical SAM enzyme
MKYVRTSTYNYNFNETTGYFERWGKIKEDDPQYSPVGPEILDIEVSTICHQGCKFCYKSNTGSGKNMSLEVFKDILNKMPMLTQVAFGIGDIDANPDLFKMFEYCRENGVVPNLTINGSRLNEYYVSELVKYCGAVAVSNYNKNTCYNAVKALTDVGLEQVNIHQLMTYETHDQIWDLIRDMKTDRRLERLNAVVFLSLKQKGRGTNYSRMPQDEFERIIKHSLENNLRIGFDSCTANRFLGVVKGLPNYKQIEQLVEPCESTAFSSYINVDGMFYPCSFAEQGEGLDVLDCDDFLQDIWFNPNTILWRKKLIHCGRSCPIYKI